MLGLCLQAAWDRLDSFQHRVAFFSQSFSRIPRIKTRNYYCWWLKSCTTKDDDYPIIYRVLTIAGGAGFLPSTVVGSNRGPNHFQTTWTNQTITSHTVVMEDLSWTFWSFAFWSCCLALAKQAATNKKYRNINKIWRFSNDMKTCFKICIVSIIC